MGSRVGIVRRDVAVRSGSRGLFAAALLAALLGAGGAAQAANHMFSVVDPGDGGDNNVGNGTCASGTIAMPGPCTLRAAIQEANAMAVGDTATITFSGVTTISPLTGLDGIGHDGVTIDGGAAKVHLDGSLHSVSGVGLDVAVAFPAAGGIFIKNLEISGFGGNGLDVSAIGVTIGGPTGGCIIHGNGGAGISISGGLTTANVSFNNIGVDATGFLPDGNGLDGVDATVNFVTLNAINISNNVISANGKSSGGGIHIGGGTGTNVAFNFIGTDKTGNNLLDVNNVIGNGDYGIKIDGGAGHLIGGQMIMTPNFISHNGYNGMTPPSNASADGIEITGTATGVIVAGNIIGLNNLGMAMPNGRDGIFISSGNNIIGEALNLLNVISGNVRNGITLQSSSATANIILNNIIGEDPGGDVTEFARPNGGAGIQIGIAAHDNTIGDTPINLFNRIAHNTGNGIEFRNSGTGNKLSANHIHDNGKLGIDIDGSTNAVDPIDPGDTDSFSNDQQNYPKLLTAVISGSTTQITGTLDSTVGDTFNLEFFDSPLASATPNTLFMGQHYGEGRNYLGNAMVSIPALAMAPTPFNVMISSAATAGHFITATATRTAAPLDTSEFSNAIQAVTPVELQRFEAE